VAAAARASSVGQSPEIPHGEVEDLPVKLTRCVLVLVTVAPALTYSVDVDVRVLNTVVGTL
jgi:hypothetical protein